MDQPQTRHLDPPEEPHPAGQAEHRMPLLLKAADAAALCGKSLRTWRAWDAAGLIPRPVRIRRSTLWRPDELRAWVAAGCPCRKDWDSLQQASILS